MTDIHALRRTSPKGTPFIGVCTKCGKEGLSITQMREECANIRGITDKQALVEILDKDN